MTAPAPSRLFPIAGLILSRIPTWAVGAIWAFAALSKAAIPPDNESWAAQFPPPLIAALTLAEACVAALLFAGHVRFGLMLGMTLLSAFVAAMLLSPPTIGQSCGCLGKAAIISDSAADISAHIFALAALHLVAAAAGRRAVLGKPGLSMSIRPPHS